MSKRSHHHQQSSSLLCLLLLIISRCDRENFRDQRGDRKKQIIFLKRPGNRKLLTFGQMKVRSWSEQEPKSQKALSRLLPYTIPASMFCTAILGSRNQELWEKSPHKTHPPVAEIPRFSHNFPLCSWYTRPIIYGRSFPICSRMRAFHAGKWRLRSVQQDRKGFTNFDLH